MKKFLKVTLIIGLVCLGVGVVATVIGALGVGPGFSKKVIVNGKKVIDYAEKDGKVIKDNGSESYADRAEDGGQHSNHHKKHYDESLEYDCISLNGINSIEIDCKDVNIVIEGADISDVQFDSTYNADYYIDEDELNISILGSGDTQYIYVPANIENKKLEINSLSSTVDIVNVKVMKLSIDDKDGSIAASADVSTDVEVDSVGGTIRIDLENDLSLYDIETDCVTSDVIIGDEDFSGILVERKIRRGNNKTIEVDCKGATVEIYGAESI